MSNVVELSAARRAATFRAMAEARYREAIEHLERGDRETYLAFLRDVAGLREQARNIEQNATAHEACVDEEYRKTQRALGDVLARAYSGGAS